jgi:hypothetical protein
MANPNIVNVSDIRGKTAIQSVTTSAATIVSNPNSSSKVFKINSMTIANIDGIESASVTVSFMRQGIPYHIAFTIVVPANSTLVVISKDTSIYLEESDSLRCSASKSGDLQAVCSYEEIS